MILRHCLLAAFTPVDWSQGLLHLLRSLLTKILLQNVSVDVSCVCVCAFPISPVYRDEFCSRFSALFAKKSAFSYHGKGTVIRQ